jgi:hypothetical protein
MTLAELRADWPRPQADAHVWDYYEWRALIDIAVDEWAIRAGLCPPRDEPRSAATLRYTPGQPPGNPSITPGNPRL